MRVVVDTNVAFSALAAGCGNWPFGCSRKRSSSPRVTAWAAEGDTREVTVTIPELGETKLQARPDGAVYLASLEAGKLSLAKTDF